ncbi:hypothetical protein NKH18_02145 [Streptomyces sp. M10(2022)]
MFVGGLTNLIDLDLDSEGNLLALSYSGSTLMGPPSAGALTEINTLTGAVHEIPTGDELFQPTGLAVGQDGTCTSPTRPSAPTASW